MGIDNGKMSVFLNGTNTTLLHPTTLTSGKVYHLCVKKEKVTGNIILYVDGVKFNTNTSSTVDWTPDTFLNDSDGTKPTLGTFQNLAIYSRGISVDEIDTQMAIAFDQKPPENRYGHRNGIAPLRILNLMGDDLVAPPLLPAELGESYIMPSNITSGDWDGAAVGTLVTNTSTGWEITNNTLDNMVQDNGTRTIVCIIDKNDTGNSSGSFSGIYNKLGFYNFSTLSWTFENIPDKSHWFVSNDTIDPSANQYEEWFFDGGLWDRWNQTNVQDATGSTIKVKDLADTPSTYIPGTVLGVKKDLTGVEYTDHYLGASYKGRVITDQPIAYWRFADETIATFILDYSGNGNNLNFSGSGHILENSKLGNNLGTAIEISNLTTTVLTASTAIIPTGDTPKSVEMVIKPSTVSSPVNKVTAIKLGGTSDGEDLFITLNDSPQEIEFGSTGTGMSITHTPATAIIDEILHLVVTYTPGILKAYVNGELVGTLNITLNTGSSEFYVGSNAGDLTSNFEGIMSDVAIYGYELTNGKIKSHYDVMNSKYISKFSELEDAFELSSSESNKAVVVNSNGTGLISADLNYLPLSATIASSFVGYVNGDIPISSKIAMQIYDVATTINIGAPNSISSCLNPPTSDVVIDVVRADSGAYNVPSTIGTLSFTANNNNGIFSINNNVVFNVGDMVYLETGGDLFEMKDLFFNLRGVSGLPLV